MKRHRHHWTGLWAGFGPFRFGHMHQCFDCDDAILIGGEAECSGRRADHHVERYEKKQAGEEQR